MSWLYAQTWLWYLIAFLTGVLLAWLLLVLPQQRRLRTLQSVAGADVDVDLYAHSRRATRTAAAAAGGAALFDSGAGGPKVAGGDPSTDRFEAVDPEVSPATTELPVQPAPDDGETAEIPVVAAAAPETDSTVPADRTDDPPAEHADAPTEAIGGDESTDAIPISDAAGAGADSSQSEAAEASADGTDPTETDAPADADLPVGTEAPAEPDAPAAEAPADEAPADESPADCERAGVPSLLAVPVGAGAFTAGRYHGSALPTADGAPPSSEFTIKGNEDSMLFHTPDSPYYGRTKAEVWFSDPADAEAAGFTSWTRNT